MPIDLSYSYRCDVSGCKSATLDQHRSIKPNPVSGLAIPPLQIPPGWHFVNTLLVCDQHDVRFDIKPAPVGIVKPPDPVPAPGAPETA